MNLFLDFRISKEKYIFNFSVVLICFRIDGRLDYSKTIKWDISRRILEVFTIPPCGDSECEVLYVSNHYSFRNKEICYQ